MRRATLVLLFIAGLLASSLLTFMITSGYWYWLGNVVPGKPSIAITDIYFPGNDTRYFNITVLNPSYSLEAVELRRILVITPEERIFEVKTTKPLLPLKLADGESATIRCAWDWGNYSGRELTVLVTVDKGSGAAITAKPPFVELLLKATFNASTPTWFLLNITSSAESEVAVSLVGVDLVFPTGEVISNVGTEPEVSEEKPGKLEPGSSLLLNCSWEWKEYRNETLTIVARTREGYKGYLTERTPPPVVIRITEVAFYVVNMTYYMNVTVLNEPLSPAPARINNITIIVNKTVVVPEHVEPPISPPYLLQPNTSITFTCLWNWSAFEGMNTTIRVSTVLGYEAVANVNIAPGTIKVSSAAQGAWPGGGRPCGEAAFSSPSLSGSSPGGRGPRICAPPALRRTSALCGLGRSRRSSRRGWPPRMPEL